MGYRGRYNFSLHWFAMHKKANALFVHPGDDLSVKYDWLKSSGRDSIMGTLGATNRRVLIPAPGLYTRTAALTLDTDYVDILNMTGGKDVFITSNVGTGTIVQTAADIRLSNLDIRNSGAGKAIRLEIENEASIYRNLYFDASIVEAVGVNLNGSWYNCEGITIANWRGDASYVINGNFYDCKGGVQCWYPGNCDGYWERCTGGNLAFGGCGGVGDDCGGTFIDCVAGINAFAMGKEFSGRAYRCRAGINSFGGWWGSGTNYGTFSGYAEDCYADGGNSFGMGHASSVQSGQIVRCRNGTAGQYAAGQNGGRVSTMTDNAARSTLTTSLTGANNDLVYTAKEYGTGGDDISIKYTPLAVLEGTISVNEKAISINIKNDGSTTAAEIEAWMEADSGVMALLASVANAGGNDGTGTIPAEGMLKTYLSGGIAGLYCKGNAPQTPIACTVTPKVVYYFDNGATFTNEGVSGAMHWDLPAARKGMKYTFCRTDYAAGEDVEIDPNGTEHIFHVDGTDSGAGDYYGSDKGTDAYWEMTIECRKDGEWQMIRELGTGDAEA